MSDQLIMKVGETDKQQQSNHAGQNQKMINKQSAKSEQSDPTLNRLKETESNYKEMGKNKYDEGLCIQALQCFQRALKTNSADYQLSYYIGMTLLKLGKTNSAIKYFERALAYDNNNENALILLGVAWSEKKQFPKALDYFRRALEINSSNATNFNLVGMVLCQIGELQLAKRTFLKSIQLNPRLYDSYSNLGKLFIREGKYKQAIPYLLKGYQLIQKDSQMQANMGRAVRPDSEQSEIYCQIDLALNGMEINGQVLTYFQRSVDINPLNAFFYYQFGRAFKKLNELPKAIRYFKRAIMLDPYQSTFFHSLGNCYYLDHQNQLALAAFSKAIKIDSKCWKAYHGRGSVYLRKKMINQANSDYTLALQLNPASEDTFHHALQSLIREEKMEDAKKCLMILEIRGQAKKQYYLILANSERSVDKVFSKNGYYQQYLKRQDDQQHLEEVKQIMLFKLHSAYKLVKLNQHRKMSRFEVRKSLFKNMADLGVMIQLGNILFKDNKVEKAINIFKFIFAKNKRKIEKDVNQAEKLFQEGSYQSKGRSVSIFLQLLEHTFADSEIFVKLGLMYLLLTERELKIKIYQHVYSYLQKNSMQLRRQLHVNMFFLAIQKFKMASQILLMLIFDQAANLSELKKIYQMEGLNEIYSNYKIIPGFSIQKAIMNYQMGEKKQFKRAFSQLLVKKFNLQKSIKSIEIKKSNQLSIYEAYFVQFWLSIKMGQIKDQFRVINRKKKNIYFSLSKFYRILKLALSISSFDKIDQTQRQSLGLRSFLADLKFRFQQRNVRESCTFVDNAKKRMNKKYPQNSKLVFLKKIATSSFIQFYWSQYLYQLREQFDDCCYRQKSKCYLSVFSNLLQLLLLVHSFDCPQKNKLIKQMVKAYSGWLIEKQFIWKQIKRIYNNFAYLMVSPQQQRYFLILLQDFRVKGLAMDLSGFELALKRLIQSVKKIDMPYISGGSSAEQIELQGQIELIESQVWFDGACQSVNDYFDRSKESSRSQAPKKRYLKVIGRQQRADMILKEIKDLIYASDGYICQSYGFQNAEKCQESQSQQNESHIQFFQHKSSGSYGYGDGLAPYFPCSLQTEQYYHSHSELSSIVLTPEMYRQGESNYRQLILNNHLELIRYLSLNRYSLKRIAKHYIDRIDKNYRTNQCFSFWMKIEKGLPEFIIDPTRQSNYNYACLILKNGRREVLNWMICLVEGILELQRCEIFHADLNFRNTIKVKKNQTQFVYKIIDFNYAFKVCSNFSFENRQKQDKCLQKTRDIIRFWLRQQEEWLTEGHMIEYMFRQVIEIDRSRYYKVKSIKKASLLERQKIDQVMKLLQQYMYLYHRHQFINSLQYLLNDTVFRSGQISSIKHAVSNIAVQGQQNIKGYYKLIELFQKLQGSDL